MQFSHYMNILSNGIESRDLRIAVVGLGYVGLPTAIAFHKAGFNVVGIDSSVSVIKSLRSGESPITDEVGMDIPSGDRWEVTTDYGSSIPSCDLAIICVPTPVDAELQPDLGPVKSAIDSVVGSLKIDCNLAIILESTVQPGTTRKCISESLVNSHVSSEQVLMAYCPERVSPGEGGYGVQDVGRVVGSEDPILTEVISQLYQQITSGNVRAVSSIEVAEASKLVENAQRDIDIAFVNELAVLLPKLGLDVEEVLSAAATKWNFHRHKPGIGVGGHCIPIDPHYYIDIAQSNGVDSVMSPAARVRNSSMPSFSAKEVVRLCDGKAPEKILILGYSYKPNVSDSRETPVLPFINELLDNGAGEILVWDPFIDTANLPNSVNQISDPYGQEGVECVVIATAHDEVIDLDWSNLKKTLKVPRIFDGRRCVEPAFFQNSGWTFHAVGRPLGGI